MKDESIDDAPYHQRSLRRHGADPEREQEKKAQRVSGHVHAQLIAYIKRQPKGRRRASTRASNCTAASRCRARA